MSDPFADTADGAAPRKGGWLRGRRLLALSLALNAFLIAMIIGLALTGPPGGPRGPRAFGPPELRAMQTAVAGGSEELKATTRALEREARTDFLALRQRILDARRELAEAVRADPFDAQRFDIALADLRAAQSHRFTLADRGLRALLAEADKDTRLRYADALLERVARAQERLERRLAEMERRESRGE